MIGDAEGTEDIGIILSFELLAPQYLCIADSKGIPLDHQSRLEISHKGRYVVALAAGEKDDSGFAENALALWELPMGDRKFRHINRGIPRSAAFLPDETGVFIGDSTGRVLLYGTLDGEVVKGSELDGRSEEETGGVRGAWAHRGSVKAMALEPSRGLLYSCGKDTTREGFRGTLRVWDAATRKPLRDEILLRGEPEAAEVSDDGRFLLISTEGGGAELWAIDLVELD